MNNRGEVAFRAGIPGVAEDAAFTQMRCLVKRGDTIGGKTLASISNTLINNRGDVFFNGQFSGGSGAFTQSRFLVGTGATIGGKTVTAVTSLPVPNDFGEVAFLGTFTGGQGIFTPGRLVVATGNTIGGKTLTNFYNAVWNNRGDVVFGADFAAGPTFPGGQGIFTPDSLLFATIPIPGTNSSIAGGKTLTRFVGVGSDALNNLGDFVFFSEFVGGHGIFTLDNLLVAAGTTIDGRQLNLVLSPVINDCGEVAFWGSFRKGGQDLSGLFTKDRLIAAAGDTIGGETLKSISAPVSLNDHGNIAFQAILHGGGQDRGAIIVATRVR